jgi:hypothetical protein
MTRPLTNAERADLEQAGRQMARDACRTARVPLLISDPEILAKAAVLLARIDPEACRRGPTPGTPPNTNPVAAKRKVRREA